MGKNKGPRSPRSPHREIAVRAGVLVGEQAVSSGASPTDGDSPQAKVGPMALHGCWIGSRSIPESVMVLCSPFEEPTA